MNKFFKIGHKGAAGYEPENTLRSFAKALELKCDMIEFDVHLAASGEPVVIHDDTLDRTTNGRGEVAKISISELKALDAGSGEKIPTLEETLDLINRSAVVNIELKSSGALKPVVKIVETYVTDRGWTYNDFMVSSFNHLDLWRAKELLPEIRTGALAEVIPAGFAEFVKELKAYSANVSKDCVTEQFVHAAHDKKIKVFVYTVNGPAEIAKIKAIGVDGIFSDFPDRL